MPKPLTLLEKAKAQKFGPIKAKRVDTAQEIEAYMAMLDGEISQKQLATALKVNPQQLSSMVGQFLWRCYRVKRIIRNRNPPNVNPGLN